MRCLATGSFHSAALYALKYDDSLQIVCEGVGYTVLGTCLHSADGHLMSWTQSCAMNSRALFSRGPGTKHLYKRSEESAAFTLMTRLCSCEELQLAMASSERFSLTSPGRTHTRSCSNHILLTLQALLVYLCKQFR